MELLKFYSRSILYVAYSYIQSALPVAVDICYGSSDSDAFRSQKLNKVVSSRK